MKVKLKGSVLALAIMLQATLVQDIHSLHIHRHPMGAICKRIPLSCFPLASVSESLFLGVSYTYFLLAWVVMTYVSAS